MVIKPGDDYATQVLGDPWDMSNVADIDLDNSSGVSSQGFSGGIFSATASGSGTTVYPLFMGVGGSIDQSRGFLHPVDTSHYRYLTLKLKVSQASVLGLFYYLQGDSGSYASGTCGATTFFPIPATNYGIVTIDLATQNQFTQVCPQPWNSSPTVSGIRFDTTASTGTSLSIDWLRLTPAATPGDKTTVQWSDTTSTTYTIAAIDAAGTSLTLATGVSGTSYQADLTILPPGAYTIKVTRTDASATASSGSFRIDSPPQIVVTSPDVHGDVSQDFATTVLGNPWGPFSATDFRLIANFKNVVYNSPAGSFDFYGRPTTGDPQWYMNLGTQMIDASYYRSFCFTMKDYGVLSVGGGSVARVFWGTSTSTLAISQDIVLSSGGPNEYCLPDLATIPIEPTSIGTAWAGMESVLRLDPIEFAVSQACMTTPNPVNCHDIELDNVRLSPFSTASPGFTFAWSAADSDDSTIGLSLYLQSDSSGVLYPIYAGSVNANATGQYAWPGTTGINYGTYHLIAVASDAYSSVSQTSTGPIVLGPRDGIFRNGFE